MQVRNDVTILIIFYSSHGIWYFHTVFGYEKLLHVGRRFVKLLLSSVTKRSTAAGTSQPRNGRTTRSHWRSDIRPSFGIDKPPFMNWIAPRFHAVYRSAVYYHRARFGFHVQHLRKVACRSRRAGQWEPTLMLVGMADRKAPTNRSMPCRQVNQYQN